MDSKEKKGRPWPYRIILAAGTLLLRRRGDSNALLRRFGFRRGRLRRARFLSRGRLRRDRQSDRCAELNQLLAALLKLERAAVPNDIRDELNPLNARAVGIATRRVGAIREFVQPLRGDPVPVDSTELRPIVEGRRPDNQSPKLESAALAIPDGFGGRLVRTAPNQTGEVERGFRESAEVGPTGRNCAVRLRRFWNVRSELEHCVTFDGDGLRGDRGDDCICHFNPPMGVGEARSKSRRGSRAYLTRAGILYCCLLLRSALSFPRQGLRVRRADLLVNSGAKLPLRGEPPLGRGAPLG